jgi:SAM-dependent methyltransferase
MSAGAQYVSEITAHESDRLARSAFCELALRIAGPGTEIFDFGAGPGIDARHYAQCGHRVSAYDVDPRMCAYLADYCREEIERNAIVLHQGTYRSFIEQTTAAADLITANFAPLNLIDDLPELFRKFHALARPRARILASVLNPLYLGDLRYGWWWRCVPFLLLRGHSQVQGEFGPIHRRLSRNFRSAALPYFALRSVMSGRPGGGRSSPHARAAGRATSRFMFLLFERR